MSKKRGVSAEEKRARLLDLFYEKKEFFQLKDLEKIAPKEKGIVVGSVKETLQYLVDNELVDTGKIGVSVYFWAFPSKAINSRKRKIVELEQQVAVAKKQLKTAAAQEAAASDSSGNDEINRKQLLENVTDLQIERDELLNAVKKYRENDPKIVEMKRERIKVCTRNFLKSCSFLLFDNL